MTAADATIGGRKTGGPGGGGGGSDAVHTPEKNKTKQNNSDTCCSLLDIDMNTVKSWQLSLLPRNLHWRARKFVACFSDIIVLPEEINMNVTCQDVFAR
jgi:hypothetical protein